MVEHYSYRPGLVLQIDGEGNIEYNSNTNNYKRGHGWALIFNYLQQAHIKIKLFIIQLIRTVHNMFLADLGIDFLEINELLIG